MFSAFATGCCSLRDGYKAVDHVEHFVLSGAGEPPTCRCKGCCVLPAPNFLLLETGSKKVEFWYRVVLFDSLNRGIEGIPIAVDLVSSRGGVLLKDIKNAFGNNFSISDDRGFGKFQFVMPNDAPATTRIRIRYTDGEVETFSYGPHIYLSQ